MKDEKVNEQTQCDPAPFRQGLALDSEGNIMVVDNGNHRLQIRHPLNLGPGQQFPVNMFYDRRLTHHLAHTRHRG